MSYLAELESEKRKNIRLLATDRTDKSALVSLVSSEQENKKSLFPDRATDTATLWRVTYPDRVITVACSEPESLDTIEAAYPGATVEPTKAPPTDPVTLTQAQAETLQAWLTAMCEGDVDLIGAYMAKVRGTTAARDYFLALASSPDGLLDERQHCRDCIHLERGVCRAAKRGEVDGMTSECRPVDLIPRHCRAFAEKRSKIHLAETDKTDKSPGDRMTAASTQQPYAIQGAI